MAAYVSRKIGYVSLHCPFKGARSDCFRFFSDFLRFWYQKLLLQLKNVPFETMTIESIQGTCRLIFKIGRGDEQKQL